MVLESGKRRRASSGRVQTSGPSIKQVSALAGVSTATVSRALRSPNLVSQATRDVVMAACDQLNYRPNHLARSLRMQKSFVIIVLVPNITNPFFAQVIRGAEQVATAAGYQVLLGDTEGDREKENALARLVLNQQADGILQLSASLPQPLCNDDGEMLGGIHFVNACELIDATRFCSVSTDNIVAAQTMTEHLLELGHTKIAIVRGPAQSPLTQERQKGVERALRLAGLTLAPDFIFDGDFSIKSGVQIAQSLLNRTQKPTAIYCFNDEMAIGMMQVFRAAGLAIPDDVSIAGFDDIEFASYCAPPLTTTAQPKSELGRAAMVLLLEKMAGERKEEANLVLPSQIAKRQSTSVPPPIVK